MSIIPLLAGVQKRRAGALSLLVHDEFTDANGTSLAAHTVSPVNTPGGGWTRVANTATIQSNRVRVPTGEWVHKAGGAADGEVRATMNCDVSTLYGLMVLRFTNTNNAWQVAIKPGGTPSFYLQEVNGGVTTTRASGTPTVNAATDYAVVVSLQGQTISATLDGANDISYGSAALNETVQTHGFRGAGVGNLNADDFKVSG